LTGREYIAASRGFRAPVDGDSPGA
jgi:hypothetical protein